jgi:signal transduction histidine kinase
LVPKAEFEHLPPEWVDGRPPRLWGRHGFWQVRLRWVAAPSMVVGLLVGRALGFEVNVAAFLLIAAGILSYNAVLTWVYSRHREQLECDPRRERLVALLEVLMDYVAIFLLIYFTGGVSSPLVVFLIFHVIITAIQFEAGTAYKLATLAAAALWLLLLAQIRGWIGHPTFAFKATLFITVAMTARVMKRLRQRVGDLARVSAELADANDRFHGLYAMATAIGPERHLNTVLGSVSAELARTADVRAVAVKLLDKDEQTLHYVATHGLPDDWAEHKTIHLDRSQLNQRCIHGEVLVAGRVDGGEPLQLRQELRDLGFRSAVLAPLTVADRVIGTLSFYSRSADRFRASDTPFLRLAAELVAIAIDNARTYQAVEDLMAERSQSMLETAHNLRAPLGAALSKLDLLHGGYLGDINERQAEHIEHLEDRLRTLDQAIGELLAIARMRDRSREIPDVVVDLVQLARKTERTFRQEAAAKGLQLEVVTEPDLPSIPSGASLLERLLENLVSNAIKYTPEGGHVTVTIFRRDADNVCIRVEDSGIGIPKTEQAKLFQEFFRASNAKKATRAGTGLGLALVKRAVERHNGRIRIDSAEGKGTAVVVDLPLDRGAAPAELPVLESTHDAD